MQTAKPQDWNTLTNISSFMTHNERRKELNIFGQLDAELDLTEYLIRSEIHKADEPRFRNKKRKKQLKTDLVRALLTLTIDELIRHYNVLVQQIFDLRNNVLTPPPQPSSSFLITQVYARSYTLKLWKKKKLRFDRENHIIYAQKDKKIKIYDLGNYLVRKSSSRDFVCLVLEAINDIPLETSKTVHFGFEFKNTFNLWINNIQASVIYRQWERVAHLLHKRQQILKNQQILLEQKKQTVILSKLATQSSAEISSNTLTQEITQKNNHSHEIIPQRQVSQDSSSRSVLSPKQSIDSSFQLKISQTYRDKQFQQIINIHEIYEKSYAFRLINQNLSLSLQQMQYELQKETQALKRAKRKVPIHKILLKGYKLGEIACHKGFKLIQFQSSVLVGRVCLYENIKDRTQLKFVYKSPKQAIQQGYDHIELLKRILDHQSVTKINAKIQKLEIKSVIYSQNCTINFEEHTPFNRLFRGREFVYLRHLVRDELGQYYIIDRSIEQKMIASKENNVRGNIFNVTRVSKDQHHIKVISNIRLLYKGNLLEQQEIKHAKQYLRHFAQGLSQHFSRQPEDPPNLTLYDYELIAQQQTQNMEGSLSDGMLNEQSNEGASKQIYRIPRAEVLMERNNYIQSIYVVNSQDHSQTNDYINRAYEPPRKPNNNYLNPKFNFINRQQNNFDWKTEVIPTWITDWTVDEGVGGLTYRGSYLKQKQLRSLLQYTSRASINKEQCSKISLPVDILAPQSHLQRLLKSMAYAPSLFDHSLQQPIIQKFKKTIAFAVLTSLLSAKVVNDFDPILGETYQCQIPSSCKGYGEQISHKVAGLLLVGKEFQISSHIEARRKVLMNSEIGQNHGIYKIKFANKQQICFTMPSWQLTGLVYSNPTFRLQGKSHFWAMKECLLLEIDFQANHSFTTSPKAKADSFRGTIYKVTPEFMAIFPQKRQKPEQINVLMVLAKIQGRWTKQIYFGDENLVFNKIPLYQMSNEHNSLPSDSSFRDDINNLKIGRMQAAQAKKEALEDQERYDQRLRQRVDYY